MSDPLAFNPDLVSRDLASIVLQEPSLCLPLVQAAPPSEFTPPYGHVIAAVQEVYDPGMPFDAWRVFEYLNANLPNFTQADFYTLLDHGPTPASFGFYLELMVRGLYRRRVYEFGVRTQALASAEDVDMIAAKLREEMQLVTDRTSPEGEELFIDADGMWYFQARVGETLIPGLLARQGRVMISGFEGHGKSTLLRQVAIAGSLGVHPFNPRGKIEPIRTLYVDLESPAEMVKERLHAMLLTLSGRGFVDHGAPFEGRMKILLRPDGLDVVGRGADRQYLASAIAMHRPDLVCIGPVYRLAAGGGDLDEATVGEVIGYLNHLRSVYNVAIMVEAHSPHGALDTSNPNSRRVLRPSGSSAWMRYPEVGRGLRREQKLSDSLGSSVYALEAWRGDRSPSMRFPGYVRAGDHGEVWFYDCTEDAQAAKERR